MSRSRLVALFLLPIAAADPARAQPPVADPPLPPGAVRRLGDTRLRPGARVSDLVFSPDGTRVVSVGWMYSETRLSVWDTATGREVFTQPLPEGTLADVGWGPDGGQAVRTVDGAPRLWAFADPAGKHPTADAKAVGPAGPRVVVVAPGGKPMETGPERVALSADATQLAVVPAGGGSVKLYATQAGAAVADLKLVATSGAIAAGSCSGLHFARGNKAVVILTDTETGQAAVVWDVEKGTVSDPVTVPKGVRQGTRQTTDVADDGSAVAVGLEDGTVKVFDLPSGKERVSVQKHAGPKVGRGWTAVSAVKFVNGGRRVLSAGRDSRQVVWDATTGVDVAALDGHKSWVEAVAVSPDGKRVATAGQDSLVRLWDAATWKPILSPEGPYETIWRVEASRDGRYAAAESGSGIYAWDLQTGKELRAIQTDRGDRRSESVLFAPEGGLVTTDGKGGLSVYPLPTGDPKPLPVKGRLLEFSPDGKTLLTVDGTSVHVWDWPAGTRRREVPLQGEIRSAAVSPDSRTAVVSVSKKAGGAAVVDLASGTVGDLPIPLHWFAHAAGFTAGGGIVCGTVGKTQAEAWSVATRARLWQFEQPPARPGHFYQLSFAVSPDGRKAATCHSDGGVAVYEMATGRLLAHFHGHRDGVISVAWTGSDRLLSGGADHQVLVWDASLRALAGKVDPLPPADRAKTWDQLGTLPAKEAWKAMAALAADPVAAVALIEEHLKPIPVADPATLDRIFRDLDAPAFAAREKASRDLAGLGPGAVAGVRERAARATSAEVRGRAEAFLKRFAAADLSPDRVRYLRALEVLTAAGTPAARRSMEKLAAGAGDVWDTEAARQALGSLPAPK